MPDARGEADRSHGLSPSSRRARGEARLAKTCHAYVRVRGRSKAAQRGRPAPHGSRSPRENAIEGEALLPSARLVVPTDTVRTQQANCAKGAAARSNDFHIRLRGAPSVGESSHAQRDDEAMSSLLRRRVLWSRPRR